MNKKVKLTVAIGAISTLALVGGAFALFSDTDEEETKATAGTVDVTVSDIEFENSKNINPGDNDPELPKDPDRPEGTSHKVTFDVESKGTKSIRTKLEITIAMKNKELDPCVFRLYKEDGSELVKKYYEVNGSYISSEEYDKLPEDNRKCTSIKYIVASDIFDGVGLNSEKEELSTVKEDKNGKAIKSYTYQLAMSQYATDIYQGEKVDINITTYAIQYRNTNPSDWYKINSQDISGFGN